MKEIDTLSFMCLLANNIDRKQIVEKIKRKLKPKYNKVRDDYFYIGKDKKYSFWFSEEFCCFIITLQHSLTVGKTDSEIIEETTKEVIKYFKLEPKQIEIQKLSRIDYKNDYKNKNEEERRIIEFILDIAVDKFGKNYIKKIEKKDGFYKVKYMSERSGYIEIIFYDKESEMLKKAKRNEITFAEAKKYENIFRTEIRIKNKRLNYEKYKNGISKDIVNYYNIIMAKMYFDYYINKILGSERFYRIDIAMRIIQKENTLKKSMKKKLCDLLKLICEKGFTKARESYKNKKTFNTHVKRIKSLGINILTFAIQIKGIKVEVESIDNFGQMKDSKS